MAAAGPGVANWLGSKPGCRRGCSWFRSSIRLIPAVESLLDRVRHFAVLSPGVEAVVDDEARQMGERRFGRGDRGAVGRGPGQHSAGGLHGGLFDQRHLVLIYENPPPRIDLLVDVDLHRADIGATAVKRRSEWQVAVFPGVEGRIDDETDRTGIGGAVAQPPAAAIDRTRVHTGAATDALQGRPELLQAEALRSAVVNEHHMHLATRPRSAEMRGILGHW